MLMDKVSVIIPTFNRFNLLIDAINSVRKQTYTNIEIIVINDGSTQNEYYEYDFGKDVLIVHLEKNSKELYGHYCPGSITRNKGLELATGKYIAFLDDDDIWFPNKLEEQINAMKNSDYKICCSEALSGEGPYDESKKSSYKLFLRERFWNDILIIFNKKGKVELLVESMNSGHFTLELLKVHNIISMSNIIIEKEIIDKAGVFKLLPYAEDWDFYMRILQYSDLKYIDKPQTYLNRNPENNINYIEELDDDGKKGLYEHFNNIVGSL